MPKPAAKKQTKEKPVPKSPGRPKGVPNKATTNAREAIARLVDGNAERMQEWLDQIHEQDGPKAAWACMMDVIEYHVPKLARTEHVGEGGGAVRFERIVREVVEPK